MDIVKTAKNNKEFAGSSSNRYCNDCKKKIQIENKQIKNGVLLKYADEGNEFLIFKCNECFGKNPSLTNFRECEVYSRIVGYLRPIKQWNLGKQKEFKERKEFKPQKSGF